MRIADSLPVEPVRSGAAYRTMDAPEKRTAA
jgi:hypothetical protein